MRWHCEIFFHFLLLFYLAMRSDGRKYFETFLAVRFIFDAAQLFSERLGYAGLNVNAFYFGVLCQFPFLLMALEETRFHTTWHRRILYAWACLNLTAAWIRFFPYTGRAVLIIDTAAYLAWTAEKMFRL